MVTARIVQLLENGTAPWRQPWDARIGLPLSMSTGRAYRGVNTFLLAITAQAAGYSSPWWGTYRQIAERGGQVRKGERSTSVILWSKVAPRTRRPLPPTTTTAAGREST
jgi:antirestriction protein ArdC